MEIKIFEIPIYAMTQKEFDRRWDRDVSKAVEKIEEYNKEQFQKGYELEHFDQMIWRYNQIIGYLVISFKNGSIWFDKYLTEDKIFRVKSYSKHIIKDCKLSGYHFYVKPNIENKEIRANIIEWIKLFEKEHLNKRYYLDKDNFLNILKYIDFKTMIRNKTV